MRSLFVSALLGACALSYEYDANQFKFMKYIAEHNKSYGTAEEYAHRFENWLWNEIFINEVNDPSSAYTHTAGHNIFSDWTEEEFARMMTLRAPPSVEPSQIEELVMSNGSHDWRDHNCVNEVQDQGSCGSCWAFTTVAAMETSYCATSGTLEKLSEQQFVDCSGASDGNFGCNGGFYDGAWDYAKTHGIERESDYAYSARDETCKYDSSKGKVKVTDYHWARTQSAMQDAVEHSTMSVAIYASSRSFQSYQSGIYSDTSCPTDINHGVAVVGYDSNDGYWVVRNSWGKSWGDGGYIKMAMATGKGICGINQYPAYPETAAF